MTLVAHRRSMQGPHGRDGRTQHVRPLVAPAISQKMVTSRPTKNFQIYGAPPVHRYLSILSDGVKSATLRASPSSM